MLKIDLHTHSVISPDGGISAKQYRKALESGQLSCVAVTDHNQIDFAVQLNKELGPRIIVGEEIMTSAGEIIGLFLTEVVPPGLTPKETIRHIKDQGGLVYIPHPFETVRKGLSRTMLDELVDDIDVVEIYNGRAVFQNKTEKALEWTLSNRKPGAASSDAHGPKGLGRTYTTVTDIPRRDTLASLLHTATFTVTRPRTRAILYPKYHRLRKRFGGRDE